jgi:hypothetical protein
MTRSKRTLTVVACAAVAALTPVAPSTAAGPDTAPVVAAKSCSSGYVHAVLPDGQKCLRAGEFCSRQRSYQRVYHRKGFHCKANRHLGYR